MLKKKYKVPTTPEGVNPIGVNKKKKVAAPAKKEEAKAVKAIKRNPKPKPTPAETPTTPTTVEEVTTAAE